jgi:hypothetical protein
MNYNDFIGYLLLFVFNAFLLTFLFKSVIDFFANLEK